jgi:hypothetical protein
MSFSRGRGSSGIFRARRATGRRLPGGERDRLHSAQRLAMAGRPRRLRALQDALHRFVRWSRTGEFERVFAALAGAAGEPDQVPPWAEMTIHHAVRGKEPLRLLG